MYFIKIVLLLALFTTTWVPVERMQMLVDSPLCSSKDKTSPPEGEEDETEELAARGT